MAPTGPSVNSAKGTRDSIQDLSKDTEAEAATGQRVSAMAAASTSKQEPTPTTIPVVKAAPRDEDSDDNVAISSATRVHQVPLGKRSQSKGSKRKETDACKPEKPPTALKGRKPLIPKDRAPLIAGDARIFTDRTEDEWMDGHLALTNLVGRYVRPFNDCIPSDQISMDNMPPFFVRLRDDQLGHLLDWISDKSRASIQPTKAASYWPWDLTTQSALAQTRDNWGKAYSGRVPQGKLPGGPELPEYTNPGLPLTYTSSGKAMCRDESAAATGDTESNGKRKAGEAMGELGVGNGKRFCAWATPETREEVMQTFVDRVEKLRADHKLQIEVLEASVSETKSTIDDLQRQKDEAMATVQAHEEVVAAKNTELETLTASITDKTKIITSLESTLTELRLKVDKCEARIKRQNTDLQKCRKDLGEEARKHTAYDTKKSKELKQAKKDLRDANAKVKSLQATIAEKARALGKEKLEVGTLKGRIDCLEKTSARLRESMYRCGDFIAARISEIGADDEGIVGEKEKVAEKGDGAQDATPKKSVEEKQEAGGQGSH